MKLDREIILQYEQVYRQLKKAHEKMGVAWDPEIDTLRNQVYENWEKQKGGDSNG